MNKINNKGFVLAETLIVTSFVAGVLLYLFIQFSNLNKNYNNSFKYNTIEALYALSDVKDFINTDIKMSNYLLDMNDSYTDITDCSFFSSSDYCISLFEELNIEEILVSTNVINSKDIFEDEEQDMKDFINKIEFGCNGAYRLIAKFKNSTFATIRFGDSDE